MTDIILSTIIVYKPFSQNNVCLVLLLLFCCFWPEIDSTEFVHSSQLVAYSCQKAQTVSRTSLGLLTQPCRLWSASWVFSAIRSFPRLWLVSSAELSWYLVTWGYSKTRYIMITFNRAVVSSFHNFCFVVSFYLLCQ